MKYIKIGWGAFQVKEDFVYQTSIYDHSVVGDQYCLAPDGKLYVSRYFTWDGPSGALNTKTFVKSSCIHDILCKMINEGNLPVSLQPKADQEMYEINGRQNMWRQRRAWTFAGVRWYQSRKRKPYIPKVYEVP